MVKITLVPKLWKDTTREKKKEEPMGLYPYEYRGENPQWNKRKPNPTAY